MAKIWNNVNGEQLLGAFELLRHNLQDELTDSENNLLTEISKRLGNDLCRINMAEYGPNDKIKAIKRVRDLTGWNLAESKNHVEEHWPHPSPPSSLPRSANIL